MSKYFYYNGGGTSPWKHETALRDKFGRDSLSDVGDSPFEFSGVVRVPDTVTREDVLSVLREANNTYARISDVREWTKYMAIETTEVSAYPSEWQTSLHQAVDDVEAGITERINEQVRKYGEQRITGLAWIAVITEEWGEAVAEYNKQNLEEFEIEIMQTIACCVRLLHEVRREHNGVADLERDMYVRQS